jgi:UMF1 family MFS transporter
MNKKAIFVWSLYDFANSFIFISFLIYFSKWLVIGQGLSDWWYNATFIIGSIGLIFLAPWFGNRADKLKKGKKYLIHSTIWCFIFYTLAIVSAIFHMNIFLSALFFGLGNFFYQFSFVFYNPLLNTISHVGNRGKISGIGFLSSYAGQICGILVALPFVLGKISLGIDPLLAALIPQVIIFILLSIPLFVNKEIFVITSTEESTVGMLDSLKILVALPGVLLFLVSFFFFNDAITTLVNNFSIFTSSIFGLSDGQISTLTLVVIVCAGIGAMAWGWLADKIGSKKTLLYILVSWVIIIPVMAWSGSYQLFFIFSVLAGLSIGGTLSTSRLVLIELVPERVLNSSFGIYAISERAATIVGPLAWSMVLSAGGYRWAMFSMVVFMVVSVFFMVKIFRKTPQSVS